MRIERVSKVTMAAESSSPMIRTSGNTIP